MADIFTEVDEALKQEKLEKLWNQYGGLFISFLVAIILATAANAGYKSWNTSKNAAQTASLLEVVDNNKHSGDDISAIAPDLRNKLRGLASIRAAGLHLEKGEIESAKEIYNAIENDKNIDTSLSQLASYMSLNLDNDLSTDDKLSKLDNIISNQENPWRYHARLDAALIEANKTNNYTKARAHLAEILRGENIAQSLKQKSQSLDIIYALKEKI